MYYIPQQNGFIEHDDRTITKATHNMLYAKSLPLCMWVKVIHTTIYFLNKLNPTCHGMGPSMLSHIIECLVVLLTCSLTNNYDPNGMLRAPRYNVVEYNTTSKGYRLWQRGTKKVKECVDVMFNETSTSLVTPSTTFSNLRLNST
jgi:hypothetical protein